VHRGRGRGLARRLVGELHCVQALREDLLERLRLQVAEAERAAAGGLRALARGLLQAQDRRLRLPEVAQDLVLTEHGPDVYAGRLADRVRATDPERRVPVPVG